MKHAGLATIVVMSLNSCVGVGIVKSGKKEHSSFGVNQTKSEASRRVVAQEEGANPSREEIRSKWGEPDREHSRDGEELWSYDSGLAVRGVIPMLGIGIPLIIPVGKNHYEFSFPAGSRAAANLVVETNRMTGGYFGVSSFTESKGFGVHKFE